MKILVFFIGLLGASFTFKSIDLVTEPLSKLNVDYFNRIIRLRVTDKIPFGIIERPISYDKIVLNLEGQADPISKLKNKIYQNISKEAFLALPRINHSEYWSQVDFGEDNLGYFIAKRMKYPKVHSDELMHVRIDKEGCEANLTVTRTRLFEEFVYPVQQYELLKSDKSLNFEKMFNICSNISEVIYAKPITCIFESEVTKDLDFNKVEDYSASTPDGRVSVIAHPSISTEYKKNTRFNSDIDYLNKPLEKALEHIENGLKKKYYEFAKQYRELVTCNYAEFREDLWLSDPSTLASALKRFSFAKSQIEIELGKLEFDKAEGESLEKFLEVVRLLHSVYTDRSKKTSIKISAFSSKFLPIRILLTYPISIIVLLIILISWIKFLALEKRSLKEIVNLQGTPKDTRISI